MKKEELDKLKAKYFAGETSLEEERQLKALEDDEFFSALKHDDEKMNWDFDSFFAQVNELEEEKKPKIVLFRQRLFAISGIAASLLLGFFFVNRWLNPSPQPARSIIAYEEVKKNDAGIVTPLDNSSFVAEPKEEIISKKTKISNTKSSSSSEVHHVSNIEEDKFPIQEIHEDQMYVEVNGVRIYDEEKALEITETAIHLATSNLKKGMEGVENIKYLKIEI